MLIRAPVLATNLPSGVLEIGAERQWDYAWTADPIALPFQGQLRLRMRARVLQGEMGFASLNRSRDRVVHEFVLSAARDWAEFDVILPPYKDFGGVVARNTGSQGQARAEFMLCGVEQPPANLYLIFQQGKVASQTIEAALRRVVPGDCVERHHLLSSAGVRRAKEEAAEVLRAGRADEVERYYAGPEGLLSQVLAAERAVPTFQRRIQTGDAWIISGMREPFSLSVASFFQNISTFCPWLTFEKQNLDTEVERAMAFYREVFERAQAGTLRDHVELAASTKIMLQPARWFEEEFTRLTNVSVYDAPLRDEGFCTFESGGVSILLYRFEALPDILPRMLRAMDLCPIEVESVNIGREKQSGGLYEAFKARFEPTLQMEEYFLGNKFAERFYPLSWQRTMLRSRIGQSAPTRGPSTSGTSGEGDLSESNRTQMDQVSRLEQAATAAQDIETRLRRRAAAAEEDADRQRRNAFALEADNADLRAQLARMRADHQELGEKQARSDGACEALRELLDSNRAALEESGAGAESLQAEILALRVEIGELSAESARSRAERDELKEALASERAALEEGYARAERLQVQIGALEAGNEQLGSQRSRLLADIDGLREVIAAERSFVKEHILHGELLEAQSQSLGAEIERLALSLGDAQRHLAQQEELLRESWDRAELLQTQLEAVQAELTETRAALQQAHNSNAVSGGLVLDSVREQVASLVRVMRSEDMAVVRREYEHLLASQTEALNEARARAEAQHRELLEAVPEIVHVQTGNDVHEAVSALVAERGRREAAEELARALETEHAERMREVSALAEALKEERDRLQSCETELAACKIVLERSRYMRARRAVLRLLGRGSER